MSLIISALLFSNNYHLVFLIMIKSFVSLLFLLVCLPLTVHSQGADSISARFTESQISIDGILDEDAWENAYIISDFIQYEPVEGLPATKKTEVRLLYGTDDLYIGAVMYDDPDAIENTLGRRDELNRADWFMVSIDSYFNRRNAYTFAVNAAGVQMDGQQGSRLDLSWDAIWFSSVRITDAGWIAEIRIPYSMLRFPDVEEQTWGIHFTRRIPRLGEISEWPHIPRTERSNLVARYGQITGIKDIEPRRNIEIRPYILSGYDIYENTIEPGKAEHDYMINIGGDIKVGLGPNIMLDATVNPDFGQVEADPAVLNLTAFETFFTEKRPFFTEGADIFRFGIGRSSLFYTRRIGAREPIIGAAKVSGRSADGLSFGILGTTAGKSFNPAHNYGVVRASQQLGHYSSAGGILTAYQSPAKNGIGWQSMTGGVDWDLRFVDNLYSFEGIAAFANRNSLIAGREDESGFMSGLTFRRREGTIDGHVTFLVFSDQYNPNDIGWTSFEQNFYEAWSGLTYNIRGGQAIGPFQRANISFRNRQRYSYRELWNMGDYWVLRTDFTTRDFQSIRFNSIFSEILGGYDIWETRGLDRWARPYSIEFTGEYITDERKNWKITPGGSYKLFADGGYEYSMGLQGDWDIGTRISFSGILESEWERSVTAWASNETFMKANGDWMIGSLSASPDALSPEDFTSFDDNGLLEPMLINVDEYSPGQYYLPVFGERDTRSLDFTIRSSLTFTNSLSLQLYTQLFLARGKYDNFSILVNPDELASFTSYPKQRDFNYKTLQTNLVMRWEYRPGSTVYLVWTQGRRERDELNPLAPPRDSSPYDRSLDRQIGDVFGIFPHNTFMLKINYAFF